MSAVTLSKEEMDKQQVSFDSKSSKNRGSVTDLWMDGHLSPSFNGRLKWAHHCGPE